MAHSQERKVLLGEAAEHLILAGLLRRGYLASQAPRAWRADDIICRDGFRIQVKATDKGMKKGWLVGRVESDPDRFYALVNFASENSPDVFIVPSGIVGEAAEKADREYHRLHPASALTGMRKIHDPYPFTVAGFAPGWLEGYRDGWSQFEGAFPGGPPIG